LKTIKQRIEEKRELKKCDYAYLQEN